MKDLQGFLAKITYYEENLKFVKVNYNSYINAANVVDSLLGCFFTQKTFEEKKAIVAAGRPKLVERLFSSLKRGKSFSQNKMEQARLLDLGFISIESQLLTEVMETKSF